MFRCTACGNLFRGCQFPAETRIDDKERLCSKCTERLLDEVPFDRTVFNALLNEADPIEHAASEYRCASLYLDDLGIPHDKDQQPLSLVGRIAAMNATSPASEVIDALQNMLGMFDTPVVRRVFNSEFHQLACESARNAVIKAMKSKERKTC